MKRDLPSCDADADAWLLVFAWGPSLFDSDESDHGYITLTDMKAPSFEVMVPRQVPGEGDSPPSLCSLYTGWKDLDRTWGDPTSVWRENKAGWNILTDNYLKILTDSYLTYFIGINWLHYMCI